MTDMLCSDAEKLIPLSAGGDVTVEQQSRLDNHLKCCSGCARERDRMASAIAALYTLRDSGPVDEEPSPRSSFEVWEAVKSRITKPVRAGQAVRQFNGWVATLAVCSLVLAVISICQTLPSNSTVVDAPQYLPGPMAQPARLDIPQQHFRQLLSSDAEQPEFRRSEY